jgi:hypothetical protein
MTEPNGAAEWLRQMFEQQQNTMSLLATQQADAMSRLESRMASYEEAREHTNAPMTTPPPLLSPSNIQDTQRPKPSLPHPEQFDGMDLTLFPQFEGLLTAKLRIDGAAIGQEAEKVWYGFGRLSGQAAVRIFPWMGFAEKQNLFTVDEFMKQLRLAFCDPRQQQKALGQINRMKQSSRPLGEFLNDFNRLILEAEGWGWADMIKKGYLKAALSTKLLSATIGIQEAESYDGYCNQLRMINDQMNEVAELTAWRTKRRQEPAQPVAQATPAPLYDTMDWQPTVAVSAARPREPRWASDEVIEERRRAGQCLRCGHEGHRVRECRTKLRPLVQNVRSAPVQTDTVSKDKRVYDDVDASGSVESGKE